MELEFVNIVGSYGGDQHWLPTFLMRLGGCSTVTAAEACLYLAARHGLTALYPGDPASVSRNEFVSFAAKMFKYVYPRMRGLTDLALYAQGIEQYAKTAGVSLSFEFCAGSKPYDKAEKFLREAIDNNCCLQCLLLEHEDERGDESLRELTWHWFTLTGYIERGDGLYAVYATYGRRGEFLFKRLWETGREPKGGLIKVCSGTTNA